MVGSVEFRRRRWAKEARLLGRSDDVDELLEIERNMSHRPHPTGTSAETLQVLRRLREVVTDYHSTLLAIATQSNGRAAQAARKAIERHSGETRRR